MSRGVAAKMSGDAAQLAGQSRESRIVNSVNELLIL